MEVKQNTPLRKVGIGFCGVAKPGQFIWTAKSGNQYAFTAEDFKEIWPPPNYTGNKPPTEDDLRPPVKPREPVPGKSVKPGDLPPFMKPKQGD